MNLQTAGGVMGEEIRIGILALREGACFRPDLEHRGLRGDGSIYLPQLLVRFKIMHPDINGRAH
jgi:hypothetical protein